MADRLEALKAAKHSIEFYGNKEPKCPHCGEDYDIGRNDSWQLYNDDDRHDVTCPSCEHEFTVVTHCSYTFSTDEQEEE